MLDREHRGPSVAPLRTRPKAMGGGGSGLKPSKTRTDTD